MTSIPSADPNAGLARQGLKRALTAAEQRLAESMEQIFRSGEHDFAKVVTLLQQNGVQPPSGAPGPWSLALLETELAAINASLDRAYAGA
jgi:hypothetical protein